MGGVRDIPPPNDWGAEVTEKQWKKCPNCKETFLTDLACKVKVEYSGSGQRFTTRVMNLIQDEHPNATWIQREQWITGICSEDCWDSFMGL